MPKFGETLFPQAEGGNLKFARAAELANPSWWFVAGCRQGRFHQTIWGWLPDLALPILPWVCLAPGLRTALRGGSPAPATWCALWLRALPFHRASRHDGTGFQWSNLWTPGLHLFVSQQWASEMGEDNCFFKMSQLTSHGLWPLLRGSWEPPPSPSAQFLPLSLRAPQADSCVL